ncbi:MULTISPECIES: hypothetical protein [Bradyrhizobium]|uniref:hypothetical protein n=1 Tax=Bradyrhizobium TaxID=374 RepID=UPI001FCE8B16|nr:MULTISPECIES: hypothetical protein [Bradyrhizobium]
MKSADFLHEDFARRIPAGDIHLNGMALLDRPGDRTMDATSDGRTRTIATISPTASAIRLTRFLRRAAAYTARIDLAWRNAGQLANSRRLSVRASALPRMQRCKLSPPEIVTGWSDREQEYVNSLIVHHSLFELTLPQEIAAPGAD